MKILFLSSLFPLPCDIAAKIRIFNMIRLLATKSNSIYLVSFDKLENVNSHKIMKSEYFTNVEIFPFDYSKHPFQHQINIDIKNKIREITKKIKPDLIISNMAYASFYVPFDLNIPAIADHHNCEYMLIAKQNKSDNIIEKVKGFKDWFKAMKIESGLLRNFSKIIVASETDKYYLSKYIERDIFVVPNAIDTNLYQIDMWDPNPRQLIFTGSIEIDGNYNAIKNYKDNILPAFKNKNINVSLCVTGKSEDVSRKDIFDGKDILPLGYVSDMSSAYYKSLALIIPISSGISARHKIIEAMAAGVPVISTSIGCEGLGTKHMENILIGDVPEKMVEYIIMLQNDKDFANKIRHKARKFVEERHSWYATGPEFLNVVATA